MAISGALHCCLRTPVILGFNHEEGSGNFSKIGQSATELLRFSHYQ